jgi:hypothetical protein
MKPGVVVMPIVPALWRLREDHEFEVSQGYSETLSQKRTKRLKK